MAKRQPIDKISIGCHYVFKNLYNLCFDPIILYILDLSKKVNKNNNNNNLIGLIVQQLFHTNLEDPSISLRNNAQLLNQIFSSHSPFYSLSSRNFLKLGEL